MNFTCATHGPQEVLPTPYGRLYCLLCIAAGTELHPLTLDDIERVEEAATKPLKVSMSAHVADGTPGAPV